MGNNGEKLPPISFKKQSSGNPYLPFIYALILSFGVMLGFVVNSITTGKQTMLPGKYNKMEDIMNYIEVRYVDTVNRAELMDKTIDKMLSGLDPHSVYVPSKDVSEMNEALEGNFEGIGIEFFIVQDTITVVTAISGGPSEIAGIKAGDRIININDSIVAGVKIKDTGVKQRLRGTKGTSVKVSILRGSAVKLIDFNIVRDKIPLVSVDAAYMIDIRTGYIRIGSFSSTTHQEFVEKLNELKGNGMANLIIDLRSNPGGYLQAATAMADELISGEKLLVYTKGKSFERQDYRARTDGVFEKGSLSILIDQYSASASEILAGAVQDWDRGTIIGRTSFGKGLVQEQYDLRDGSALRLTVARYYTPSGRCIQRSYDKGVDDYNNEIYERYQRGEFVHQDSIVSQDTTVYQTSKGKRVYGGGGIRPDIFVAMDTSKESEYFLSVRSYVPEFVYKYSSLHEDILGNYKSTEDFKKRFIVTDDLVSEFYHYANDKGLKNGEDRKALIATKLKQQLKAFLAKQKWRMDGFYYIMNDDDEVVKAALHQVK
ncbi:MAG: S41 family peptidase [Bacteroidota bacterium]